MTVKLYQIHSGRTVSSGGGLGGKRFKPDSNRKYYHVRWTGYR
jgi:hypothetical protein